MMITRRCALLGTAALLCSGKLAAHEYYALNFKLIHPWTLPTQPGQGSARVSMVLDEVTAPDRLLGARFEFAESAELRRGLDDASEPLSHVEIAPGERMDFKPEGPHVLLKGLKQPLLFDRSYPLELRFERSGTLTVMMSMSPGGD